MAGKLGILFLHHTTDKVVLNNLASVWRHNPSATIITMSAGQPLGSGYTLEATPELKGLHMKSARRGSDWLVCSWYVQRKEQCAKWWIIEWDTYCTVSARDYYRPVWHFPFVASSVRLPKREPEWSWFRETGDLPKKFAPYILGAVPFLYLVSDHALKRICEMLLKNSLVAGNGELRFSTVANKCGFPPCGYSPPNDQITWIPWRRLVTTRRAIFHPVKHHVRGNGRPKSRRSGH
jgi:hypothetical protein